MSAKLSAKLRYFLRIELQAQERYRVAYSMKAIQERHGVSRQTLSRLRAELLREGLRDKTSLEAKRLTATADASCAPSSNQPMTDAELAPRIAEIERRLDARDRGSVDIGEKLVALLDETAARQNTTRDHLAASAVHRWLRDNTDLLRPVGSATH